MKEIKIVYCVGLMFSEKRNSVVLISKNRPAWQDGKLNGIGGVVEPYEAPVQAMTREFKEETGYEYTEWDHFLNLYGKDYVVYFLRAFNNEAFAHSHTTTDESIVKVFTDTIDKLPVLPNIKYIIRMALDQDLEYIEIHEKNSPKKPQRSPGIYY